MAQGKGRKLVAGAIGLMLTGGMLLTPLSDVLPARELSGVEAAVSEGWNEFGDGKVYYYVNGQKKLGLYKAPNGKYYYFDKSSGDSSPAGRRTGGTSIIFIRVLTMRTDMR